MISCPRGRAFLEPSRSQLPNPSVNFQASQEDEAAVTYIRVFQGARLGQNFQQRITSVIIINVYEILPVLTRQQQKKGAFLREPVGQVTMELMGEMCGGRDQKKILRKGSSLEEKPWRFERLCLCGNPRGEVNSTLLYWSQSKPIGEMTVQSSPFQSESSNSDVL